MIKVTTEHGTIYIIDEENKQIKRVPASETAFISTLKGFINTGEFQPYIELNGLEIDNSLYVIYPNEQRWSVSTPIASIDYEFEEE